VPVHQYAFSQKGDPGYNQNAKGKNEGSIEKKISEIKMFDGVYLTVPYDGNDNLKE
jgi:hypothetical protein